MPCSFCFVLEAGFDFEVLCAFAFKYWDYRHMARSHLSHDFLVTCVHNVAFLFIEWELFGAVWIDFGSI